MFDVQDKLFYEKNHVAKEEYKQKINCIIDSIIRFNLESSKPEIIKKYESVKENHSLPYFLWRLEFAKVFTEKGGFDIVIGNPPYIGEEGNKELFQEVANTKFGSEYYIGKMDFWYFFTSKGIELLKTDGILSYVAPNNWMTTAGGKNMRKHIANSTKIKLYTTFNNVMIFESASQQTMIFVLEKTQVFKPYKLKYKAIGNKKMNNNDLQNFLSNDNEGVSFSANYSPEVYKNGCSVQFLDAEIFEIIEKIRTCDTIFLNNDEVLNGIHPHHASVTKKMLELLPDSNVGDGIFILSDDEIQNKTIPVFEQSLLKPYYDSSKIKKYVLEERDANSKIIYTTSDFKDQAIMDKYPVLRKHLDKYVSVITSDNRPYGLHRARKQDFFEKPSIASLRKCKVPTFTYIDIPAYLTAEYYLIKSDRVDLKYLTCLFNSNLVKFWLLKMGKMQGNIYQVDKEPLVNIPIAIPEKALENEIIALFDEIEINSSEVLAIQRKIDEIVYSIYGLCQSEITKIENEIKDWENS